ncbi:YceI family protein [Novosphingobium sp. JCM 18896]|uniref:YceI family protein n=1 Tax=Novosphingobium sp. JCM 18896 TaxID=2989731 RepID=UPI002222CA54|nr:YceI family protein [Novosphingobium sp. JCM 18896]MCW1428255.1 YceI family protein [Novosphingobium sp. JCM 18896]
MSLSRKNLGLIAAAAALAVTAPLIAQQAPSKPGARDAARITGGSYTVDNEHTLVRWKVDHLGITPYLGIFGQITGSLTLDPKNPNAAKVDVTIPVAKVTTASPGLTAHLLKAPAAAGGKPDFFGPTPADARFVSTAVVADAAAGTAKITGNLTVNGVTKPVTLDASFYGAATMPKEMGGGEMVGFEAKTTIKRSDFGVNMGIPLVSDEVDLEIVAAFVKK